MKWIKVEDELPEFRKLVIVKFSDDKDVTDTKGSTAVGYLGNIDIEGNHWYYMSACPAIKETTMISHWMPFPEPPED